MGKNIDRWNRAALIVALGAALALAACGRKSGLDTPAAALAARATNRRNLSAAAECIGFGLRRAVGLPGGSGRARRHAAAEKNVFP